MGTILPKDDLELQEAFRNIISGYTFSDYILDIAELICKGELDKENIEIVLNENGIKNIQEIKKELLYLLISYINLILKDHVISHSEKRNIQLLKMYFKIEEGDFYKYNRKDIETSLAKQFELLYNDNMIDKNEALYNVDLQDLFNLGYDQIEEIKRKEVEKALNRGANITDLDTINYPK